MKNVLPFDVRFVEEVTFRDCKGNVLKVYAVDDIVQATADMGHYWVTAWGGIYKTEAVLVLATDHKVQNVT